MKKYKSLLYIFNIGIALHSATPLAAFSFNLSDDTSAWQTPLGYYTPYVPIYEPMFVTMNGLFSALCFTTQKIIENPKIAWACAGCIALGAYIYTKNLKTNLATMIQQNNQLNQDYKTLQQQKDQQFQELQKTIDSHNQLNQNYNTLQQQKDQQYQELQEKNNQLHKAQEAINSQNDILQKHDQGIDHALTKLTTLQNQLRHQASHNQLQEQSFKRRHSDSDPDHRNKKRIRFSEHF